MNVSTVSASEGAEVLEAKTGVNVAKHEINDFKMASTTSLRVKSDNNKATDEFQRLAKISDDIIRYMVIREERRQVIIRGSV